MNYPLSYPLSMSFKIMAIAPQISVTDANGNWVFYVKQKILKLKEAINIFSDNSQSQVVYTINADRIIDFSARYNFADAAGMPLGAVKRKGMRSLWKAHYQILEGDSVTMEIHEESAWVKVLDGLFGGLPIIGMFSGYFFNPAYLITRGEGEGSELVLRVKKEPAFFEGKFTIEKKAEISPDEEARVLLSVVMMTLLERVRG